MGSGSGSELYGTRLSRFLDAALSSLGVKYQWGGNNLWQGVDCSGLINTALQYAGYRAPRTAATLQNWTSKIKNTDARPGDLVFWQTTGTTDRVPGADHAGIYLGNGQVLEASSGTKRVVIRKLWGNYSFGRIDRGLAAPINVRLGTSGLTMAKFSGNANWAAGLGGNGGGDSGGYAGAPGPEGENSTDPYAQPPPPTLSPNATEEEIVQFILDNYGPAQIAMLKIPEIRKVLLDAARGGITGAARFQVELEKTGWWQSRSEAMRRWDILEASDPREATDLIEKRTATMRPLWESMGVDADIGLVARDMERLGLNEAQLNQRVTDSLQQESSQSGLDAGTTGAVTADELIRIARMEYLVPIDRQTAERWAIKGIRQGESIEQGWRSYLATVAAPALGINVASGITPGDVAAPIKATVAQTLEMDANAIDLLDERFKPLLQAPTAGGGFRPMTAAEAGTWARSQESYKGTAVGRESAANLGEALAKTFGQVA